MDDQTVLKLFVRSVFIICGLFALFLSLKIDVVDNFQYKYLRFLKSLSKQPISDPLKSTDRDGRLNPSIKRLLKIWFFIGFLVAIGMVIITFFLE